MGWLHRERLYNLELTLVNSKQQFWPSTLSIDTKAINPTVADDDDPNKKWLCRNGSCLANSPSLLLKLLNVAMLTGRQYVGTVSQTSVIPT